MFVCVGATEDFLRNGGGGKYMEQIVSAAHLPLRPKLCVCPFKDCPDPGARTNPQQEIKDRARNTLDLDLNDASEVGRHVAVGKIKCSLAANTVWTSQDYAERLCINTHRFVKTMLPEVWSGSRLSTMRGSPLLTVGSCRLLTRFSRRHKRRHIRTRTSEVR